MIKWPQIYEKITKKKKNNERKMYSFYFAIPIIVLHFDIISLDKNV